VEFVGWGVLALLAAIVFVPLAWEYTEFLRAWGLAADRRVRDDRARDARVGIGYALALPLGAHHGIRWLATVLATLVAYSLVVRSVEEIADASSDRAPARPR
jgi:hypothetical protein